MIPRSLAVIPARIGSTRLPRKPLQLLAGRPLIEWVWRRTMESNLFAEVVIATDSEEIAARARGFGATVEMTAAAHPSGTDRIAEVAERPRYRDFPLLVNVQGDELFLRASDLAAAARLVSEGWPIGTIATRIRTSAELHDPAVVKVVRGDDGGALYFSRAAIPFSRDVPAGAEDLGSGLFLRHIGLYAYARDALLRWVALPEGDVERVERLEQLRALAAGIGIGVGLVEPVPGGIDTPDDLRRAETLLLQTTATEAETT